MDNKLTKTQEIAIYMAIGQAYGAKSTAEAERVARELIERLNDGEG